MILQVAPGRAELLNIGYNNYHSYFANVKFLLRPHNFRVPDLNWKNFSGGPDI